MSSNSSQNIQVTIEFGHHATFRKKPSSEGYTHDWTVFVRGPEGSKIQHYVEKVVFQLHESFSKPKRVVKDPPYQVSESGYAGFNLPIVIYFRSKEKPKKLSFDYDLFLHADQCTKHVHYEQLTFTNPNEEFRHKLLKACGQPMGTPSSLMDPSSVGSVSKSDSNVKKVKSSSSFSKDISSSKSKHKSSNISGNSSKPLTPQSTPVASKEIRSATSTPSSTSVASKEPKSRGKEAQKRPSTSSPPDGEMSGKKLKRSSSVSSEQSKDKHTHKSDKHKHSKDSSKKKSKHEHKSNKHGKKEKHSSKSEKKEKSSKHTSSSEHKSKKSSSDSLPILPLDIPTKTALLSPLKVSSDEDDEEEERTMKKDDSDSVSSPCSDLSSSSSSISLSPLPEAERKKNSSKYDSLMADLGDPDTSDDDFNVPIPIVPLSPLDKSYTETKPSTSSSTKSPKTVSDTKSPKKVKSSSSSSSQSKKSNSKPEKTKLKETKVKKEKESKSSKVSKSNSKEREPSVVLTSQNGTKEENKGDTVAMNGETISSLWALHDRIMASRDSEMLDEVVGLIQETGLFKVTDTTFDFDLCVLDKETVQKIFKCVSSVS